MADSDNGERTEEATAQRREDFRKRGQVAQTKELGSVLVLFSSLGMIYVFGRFFFEQIYQLLQMTFAENVVVAGRGHADYLAAGRFALEKTFYMATPILGVLWLISFVSTTIQVGFLYNEEAFEFKLDRLDPVQGMFRLFSFKALIEGAKSLLKLSLIMVIAYFLLRDQLSVIPNIIHFTIGQILIYIGDLVGRVLGGIGLFMTALALGDYMIQRWQLEKEMKMTKQEVREEIKSREGDPMVKGRIKRLQREAASRRMMEEVPKADVIVTNPTHIAIALKYDETMVAPKVLAKGADLVAERIKAMARELNIPVVENKPLARAIFKTIKIGQSIPRELYTAVAEVLSYVYRLKKKAKVK
jgi:flagellar biosynthesis protein FlhB